MSRLLNKLKFRLSKSLMGEHILSKETWALNIVKFNFFKSKDKLESETYRKKEDKLEEDIQKVIDKLKDLGPFDDE